ncbi:MAG: hypothetical protein E8D46_17530 [Nitrospira sp.]|nr:MAG: hypothetical protein E8D46_17530 [Nitrospira sp.]
MKAPILALLVFCAMVTLLVSPSTSTAAISVIVDGSAIAETCGSDTELQFILSECSGTGAGRNYTTFTIRGLNGQPAKVRAIDNTGDEELRIENALIVPLGTQPATCNASNSNYVNCANIVFSKILTAGPSATGSTSVTYYRKANGSLVKTNGTGATLSTFRVHGWVEDADVGVENPIGSAQAKTASSASFTFVDAGTPLPLFTQSLVFLPISLSHERELKGQFWFGFKAADHQLKLQYIKLQEPTGQGGGGDAYGQTIANDPSVVGEDGSGGGSGCIPCCRMCPGKHRAPRDLFSHDGDDKKQHDGDKKQEDDTKQQKN